MKFKILKGTSLFDKLNAINKRVNDVEKAARSLVKEMGFKEFTTRNFVLAGGISSIVAKDKPDGYAFAFDSKHQYSFYPKKNKANKELLEKLDKLPVVEYEELNSILKFDGHKSNRFNGHGGKTISFHPGIVWKKNYILIDVAEYVDYKPVKEMTEITFSEYEKLKKKK